MESKLAGKKRKRQRRGSKLSMLCWLLLAECMLILMKGLTQLFILKCGITRIKSKNNC